MRKRDELADPNICLNRAGDGEIVFVLLERDHATPGTIRDWIARRVAMGKNRPGDPELLDAEQIARMIEAGHEKQEDRP